MNTRQCTDPCYAPPGHPITAWSCLCVGRQTGLFCRQPALSCFPPFLHWRALLLVGSGVWSWGQQRSRTTQCWAVGYLFTSADSEPQGMKTFVESNILCLHSHDFILSCLPQCTEENNNVFKFNYHLLYTKRYSSCPIKQRVVLYINPTGKREQPQLQVWLITDPDCYRWQTNCLKKICEVSSFFRPLL